MLKAAISSTIALLGAFAIISPAVAAVAADGLACKAGPLEAKSISVMADWLPWGSQAGLWEAKQKGIYSELGLDVDIKAPPNPADPIKLVAMKRVNFSMSYVPEVMMAREQTIPVKSVGVLLQTIDSGLAFLPDKNPIKTVADLKGKTLGVGPKADAQAYLRTLLESGGLKREDVKIVDPGFAHVQMIQAEKVDAIHALRFGEARVMTLRQKKENKPDAGMLLYRNHGVPAFHYMLLVSNDDWVAKHANVACTFLKGTMLGIQSALKDPKDVTKFITEARPGVYTLEENTDRWETMMPQWKDKEGKMLRNNPELWKEAQEWALKVGLIREPVESWENYFTNAYVPKQ